MNNSYVVENGKVFVSDHAGVIEKRKYTDNIEQILIEENILERIQDEMKEIEPMKIYQEKNFRKFMSSKIPYTTLFCLGIFGLIHLFPSTTPNTAMVLISEFLVGFGFVSFGVCGDIFRHKIYKNEIKIEERYNALEELQVKQKSKVQSLKKEKNKNNINNNVESVTLNHKKEVENLNLMIQEYMDYVNINHNIKEEQSSIKKLILNKK